MNEYNVGIRTLALIAIIIWGEMMSFHAFYLNQPLLLESR